MKKFTLFLLAVFALGLTGCSKDAEINSFLTEWDSVTNEMVTKIEAGDIAGAQTAFDGKKQSLKSSWDGIKTARGMQVSEDTKKKLDASVQKNMTNLMSSMQKGAMKIGADRTKADQLQALIKEYGEIFKM